MLGSHDCPLVRILDVTVTVNYLQQWRSHVCKDMAGVVIPPMKVQKQSR